MKSFKIAMIVTILVAVAYAVSLLTWAKIPADNYLVLMSREWLVIELPFQVSAWWNMLLFPVIVVFITFICNTESIIGEEPFSSNVSVKVYQKYHVRHMMHMMHIISGVLSLGSVTLMVLINPIVFSNHIDRSDMGAISVLANGIFIWTVCYVGFGIAMEFLMTLGWETTFDDEYDNSYLKKDGLTERYLETSAAYAKQGIIKSFPFLLGMALGFVVRLILLQIDNVILKIKKIRVKIQMD